ncbi:MAG: cupin domain-containing protein [Burkholderiales bacterium]|nr:cupin domain-containing protein [Burkholderiales bacterium]
MQTLAQSHAVRIERIVSKGHATPPDFWYDQAEHEWVILLKGEAHLRFEHEAELTHLRPGDHVLIPAHVKHRVEWTTPAEETVWLAVFYT